MGSALDIFEEVVEKKRSNAPRANCRTAGSVAEPSNAPHAMLQASELETKLRIEIANGADARFVLVRFAAE
jgi:hypothetical protein